MGFLGDFFESLEKQANKRQWDQEMKRKKEGLEDIDTMDGYEFEKFIRDVLLESGFDEAILTSQSGDYGVDIIGSKDQRKVAIQVKRYSSSVSVDAIKEVTAGKNYYGCYASAVITNSDFTRRARELARANNCRLLNRDNLLELIPEDWKDKQKFCGDFGGYNDSNEPCSRPAGAGISGKDTGRCKKHVEASESGPTSTGKQHSKGFSETFEATTGASSTGGKYNSLKNTFFSADDDMEGGCVFVILLMLASPFIIVFGTAILILLVGWGLTIAPFLMVWGLTED